jgi:hypothetical protein
VRRPILITTVTTLTFAAAATAAGPTVVATVTPDKAGAVSKLTATATGPFTSDSGLPTSATFKLQKGFNSSATVRKVLCTSSEAQTAGCPAASQIGTGTAVATGTSAVLGSVQDTISLKLFLAAPQQAGDISSVVVEATDSVLKQSFTAVGRVLKSGGQLELLLTNLPSVSLPGVTITLDSLSLSAFAKRTVVKKLRRPDRKPKIKRTVLGLIVNPKRCTAGHWTGSYDISFQSGTPLTGTLSIPCRAS